MPVLGHAFVGLAIGVSTEPPRSRSLEMDAIRGRSGFWVPAVVTLAYLPDVVGQLGLVTGWSQGRIYGHSALLAVAASPAIAVGLARLTHASFRRALITTLISLLVHDALDLCQATDRAPWWPLSDRPVAVEVAFIPTSMPREVAVFGGLLIAFVATRHLVLRQRARPLVPGEWNPRRVGLATLFVVAVVAVAGVTHALRDRREAEFETARHLVEQRRYAAGLDALAHAERWPSTAKPGRVDYLRAEAYAGLGDRDRAEVHYLRAYRADPSYLWAVADLALFYASSDRPAAERRRLAAPYANRLRSAFAAHPALPAILDRMDRKLAQ